MQCAREACPTCGAIEFAPLNPQMLVARAGETNGTKASSRLDVVAGLRDAGSRRAIEPGAVQAFEPEYQVAGLGASARYAGNRTRGSGPCRLARRQLGSC